MPLNELKELLENLKTENLLKVELIFIAMPLAKNIANIFSEIGVNHVLYFNFSKFPFKIRNPKENEHFHVNEVQEFINCFTINFYEEIIEGSSVYLAFNKAQGPLCVTVNKKAK